MSLLAHNYLSDKISENIIDRINTKKRGWKQVFTPYKMIELQSTSDWPSPDFIHQDTKKDLKCAYELKPPEMQKGEYVKGLGQAIAYRQYCDYSTLVIPIEPLGKEIGKVISREKLRIGLITYAPSSNIKKVLSSLTLEIPLKPEKRRNLVPLETTPFWAYYRDASSQEVYLMLKFSEEMRNSKELDIRGEVFEKLFNLMVRGKTSTLHGLKRRIRDSPSNRRNYKKNYTALFTHLDLWDSDGRLTDVGRSLFQVGETEGYASEAFTDLLGGILLINGKHLRLMNFIEEFQNKNRCKKNYASGRNGHLRAIEHFLEDKSFIKRNPKKGKKIYKRPRIPLQDEVNVWGKLGFLKEEKGFYFMRGEGFLFDYQRILSVINPIIAAGTARRRL